MRIQAGIFKSLLLFILIIAVVLQSCLMVRIFQLNEINDHAEVIKKMEEKNEKLQYIILTKKEFENSKVEEREIIFEGEMFDIKTMTFDSDFVYISGYFDDDETSLISAIEKFFDFSGHSKILKTKITDYWYNQSEKISGPGVTEINVYHFPDCIIKSIDPATESPPPKS